MVLRREITGSDLHFLKAHAEMGETDPGEEKTDTERSVRRLLK